MAEIDYRRASVLLFDPVHVNLRTTRYALHEIGFRQIECVGSLKDFERYLSENSPDLVVAESAWPGVDVLPLVREIRHGEIGENPFMVVLLTSWVRDGGHVRRAIESGADDVIARPFSTTFVEERVRTLVRGRKAFVVTSDYIGPDRRKDASRKSDAPVVNVPNTLKAVVEDDEEGLIRARAWIGEARKTVESERLRRLAMRMVISIELQINAAADGSSPPFDHGDMTRTAAELRRQLVNAGRQEAAEVAEALCQQVATLKTPAERNSKNFRLVKDLAVGAYAAYAGGASIERSKDEIARTVVTLRRRLLKSAESGGGAEGQPALHSAAM
ncbi:MAG: response regulator [Maricaulaceae bacterium]|nr:response regulator [Maricaulaceae bacterium]